MPPSVRKEEKAHLDTGWLGMPLVRMLGISEAHAPRPLGMHRNSGYEITYLAKGDLTWLLADGRPLHLTGGHFALTQPRVAHRGEWDIIPPSRLFWVIFDPRRKDAPRHAPLERADLRALDRRYRRAGNLVAPAGDELPWLWDRLYATLAATRERGDDPLHRSRVRMLIAQILLAAAEALEKAAPVETGAPVLRALEYMQDHLERDLPVGELAAVAGLSESRFHARFRREIGQPPAEYLQRLRCARARERLAESDAPVTDIALSLGFSSSQYFARCFRKFTGLSPTGYRARARSPERKTAPHWGDPPG